MSDIEYLELGIIEFEKELKDDCNNEWLKRVVAGMKKCYQRLEEIEKANPSRALEILDENIIRVHVGHYPIIKQALLKAQEQEKVLEIIKEKNVDIVYLKDSISVEEYNSHFGVVVCKITPEEYDAVKELIK